MERSENGRSMVEMLGVLAIIGVLSITGIAGYTMAMRRHHANEIAQAASVLAIMAQAADSGQGDCVKSSSAGLPQNVGGFDIEMTADATVDGMVPQINIHVTEDNEDICDAVRELVSGDAYAIDECGSMADVTCSSN